MNDKIPVRAAMSALDVMILAKKTKAGIDDGSINLGFINTPLPLVKGHDYSQSFDSSRLKTTARNLEIATEEACVVAIDCAMNEVYGDKDKLNLDEELGASRAIVYMLRCAFTHGNYCPVWVVKQKYRRVYEIKRLGLKADFHDLNGKIVTPSHIGGWEAFFGLLLFCIVEMNNELSRRAAAGGLMDEGK